VAQTGIHLGQEHFDAMFEVSDPWNYTSPYETKKYEQTFSLLSGKYGRVLEVGCAEGLFTERLAVIADKLVAVDISQVALSRAMERLAGSSNVEFRHADIFNEEIVGEYDLIVCSEIFYYVPDVGALRAVLGRLLRALRPGGHLVMAHAKEIVDDPLREGFDFAHPFGVHTIVETTKSLGAHLEKELQAPLYSIQRFVIAGERCEVRRRYIPMGPISPRHAAAATGLPTRSVGQKGRIIPALLYEWMSHDGTFRTSMNCTTPATFTEHMKLLHENDYDVLSLEQFHRLLLSGEAVSQAAVMLMFSCDYEDFVRDALPVLGRYGFPALLFVSRDALGNRGNDGDSGFSGSLLTSDELVYLERNGIAIGSHIKHPLSPVEPSAEAVKEELACFLKYFEGSQHQPVSVLYSSEGDHEALVADCAAHLAFDLAFTRVDDAACLSMDPMRLPCIKMGDDDTDQFTRKLTTVIASG
jgi:SAM-dependent methyltransferase